MKDPKRKSMNRLALQGIDIDDMEFVETFGLATNVAYTPKINQVMLDNMKQLNYQENLITMPERQAKLEANKRYSEAKKQINNLYKLKKMKVRIV